MKKLYYSLFLLLSFSCVILSSCDSSKHGEATCKHDYEISEYVEATCKSDGYKIEICTLCEKEKKTKYYTSHNYTYNNCLDYEKCSYCKAKNDVFVYHSTNNGTCEKCGEYFVSKDIQLTKENNRHTLALQKLKSSYDMDLQEIELEITLSKSACTYSKSECSSKISSLDSQIRKKESELNNLNGSTSPTASADRINLQLQIQKLQTERSRYQEVLKKWNSIESLENRKHTLSNKYHSDVKKENSLHASNLAKIDALKY